MEALGVGIDVEYQTSRKCTHIQRCIRGLFGARKAQLQQLSQLIQQIGSHCQAAIVQNGTCDEFPFPKVLQKKSKKHEKEVTNMQRNTLLEPNNCIPEWEAGGVEQKEVS